MIEKTQSSGNISASLNYLENGKENEKEKLDYLDKNSNFQIRELFDKNGNKISAKTGLEIAKNFKNYEIKIYNPTIDLDKKELHNLAKDIAKLKEEFAKDKIDYLYAIHHRPDGSNSHLHIVYLSNNKKSLERVKGVEWQKALTKLEGNKYLKNKADKEKLLNYYNKSLKKLKSKKTGTEKIDEFIKTHINKSNGNFSLKRAFISIEKSKSIKNKNYWKRRLEGRLKNLEKMGIAKKIDKDRYQINKDKFEKMIKDRAELKIEKHKLILEKNQIKDKLKQLQFQKEKLKLEIKNQYELAKVKLKHYRTTKLEVSRIEKNIFEVDKKIEIEKIKSFDYQLLKFGKINVFKGAEFLYKNTKLNVDTIKDIAKTQLNRLEQLEKRGLVERKGNNWIVKDQKKFLEYLKSQNADKDREKLVEKKVKSKTIAKKVDNWINKQTKITPVRSWSKSYRALSKAFGKSAGDKVLAFAISTAYSLAVNTLKLAFKITYSFIKSTSKIISKELFKAKIKSQHKDKKQIDKKEIKKEIEKKIKDKNGKDKKDEKTKTKTKIGKIKDDLFKNLEKEIEKHQREKEKEDIQMEKSNSKGFY